MSDMKIDPLRIKALRDQRAWSQEHLASVADLSLRTIQRIESDGTASAESAMALAAALQVDVAALRPAPVAAPIASSTAAASQGDWARYRHLMKMRKLALYGAVGIIVLAIDVGRDGRLDWAYWPILGMAIALLLRFTRPVRPDRPVQH